MGTHISILEAILVSVASLLIYIVIVTPLNRNKK
jgi:hypothetical protein